MNETPQNPLPHSRQGAAPARAVGCAEMESLSVLYACDELESCERASVEAHVAACPACAAVFERETRLQHAVLSLDQPADTLDRSGLLLAQCRSELAETLDDRAKRAEQQAPWAAVLSPVSWWAGLRNTLIYHPAMSMAALLVVGFVAGVGGQRLRVVPPQAVIPARPVMTASSEPATPTAPLSSGASRVTDEQLRRAESAHVAWVSPADSRTPTVQVELNAPTPMQIVGAPSDADVERALRFVLENGQRFDPDVRLDSLDVLRTNAADPDVRQTLCAAARLDRNPGVRIKALDALQGYENDPSVRDALLDALESDANSGVRVDAIRLLLSALQSNGVADASEQQMAEVLRDRLHNDPSPTVRRQSAAALRALGE